MAKSFENIYKAVALIFGPLALQHARIFPGGENLEFEVHVGDIGKLNLALTAEKNRVGVAIIIADKIVRQNAAFRHLGQDCVEAQRAHEDGFEIRHAPFAELGLYGRWGVLYQIGRETLKFDSAVAEAGLAF